MSTVYCFTKCSESLGLCLDGPLNRSSYAVCAMRQIMRLRWAGANVRCGMRGGLGVSAGV